MKLPRKTPSLRLKLDVALRQLGLDPATAILDHHPALFLREKITDADGTVLRYIPDDLDPAALRWIGPEENAIKTNGRAKGERGTVANGDIHKAAKIERIQMAKGLAELRAMMSDAATRLAPGAPKKQKAPSRWGSRPFPKRAPRAG